MTEKHGPNYGKGAAYLWLVAHVNYDGAKCLIWPFFRDPDTGRGKMGHKGKMWFPHRLMCVMVKGPAPKGKPQAMHSCGNGHEGCVHPRHLDWGTNSLNQKDRRRHGTHGGNNYGNRTRLTPGQIAYIRQMKGIKSQPKLADELGVKRGTIQRWQRAA